MNLPILPLTATLDSLPPLWPEPRLAAIQAKLPDAAKLVVLDDDPTGTQTVFGVPVLTTWAVDDLVAELSAPGPVFYILTNSRSLPLPAAQALNAEIGANLAAAQTRTGRRASVVSRSDSTLRGHYPGEVDALAAALGLEDAATLIIPFFLEGGRFTIGNVHYVAEGDQLIPAAQTPFAQDAAFGYRHSDLRAWVEEKTDGRVSARDVAAITLDDLRRAGPGAVAHQLAALVPGQVAVANAAHLRDLEVLVDALLDVEATGKHFVYRTAASFVQIRAGLPTRPLLTAAELELPSQGGGLFVVGSYVPKSTSQVAQLLARPGIAPIEIAVPALLDPARRHAEIARGLSAVEAALSAHRDTVVYTSRELVTGADAAHSLAIGQKVSSALVEIVAKLSQRPRYLVAKGGITASDIATRALKVRRALVMGQILPGVPVWQTGAQNRSLPYIVFPGNVGGPDALAQIAQNLALPSPPS